MRTQVLSATIALGLLLSSGGCRKTGTSLPESVRDLDQLEKAPARTIAQVPASHEARGKNNLRANDLVHGDGAQRLGVIREWSGTGTTNTHFGKGWADENVFRLTQIDAGTVLLWRGGLGWRTAHGAKGKFTSATGESIERAGAGWNYRSKSGATLNFDESGKLISETSAFGVTRNYSYDAGGRLTAVGDSAQNSLRYTYDKEGRVLQIEGPEGLRSVYRYDDKGLLMGATNSANVEIEYRYDNSGELASVKDQFGRQTEMAKLPALAPVSDTSNSPPPGEIERDERGAVKTAVIGGDKIAFRYDKQGALESLDSPAGSTGCKHDAFGRLVEVIQPGGGTTRFEYNNLGLPTLVAAADGSSERLTYNKYGMPVRRERSASDWEEFIYDTNARLVTIRSAPTAEEKLSYDDQDQLIARKTAGGAEVTYGYDLRGNLLTESWSTGEKISRVYNAKGQLAEVVGSNGLRTQFIYGDKGQLIETSDPVHGKVSYSESPQGRTIEREGIGKFSLQLTPDGAPLSITTPAGGRTLFQLDKAGRPLATISADRLPVAYSYDKAHRLSGISLPGGATITLKRDALGRTTDIVRGDIVWRQFRYEASGRIAEEISPAGSAAKYVYDSEGRLKTIGGPQGEAAISYESGDRLSVKSKAFEIDEEFTRDGLLARRNYKSANLELRLPHDAQGRAAGIELNDLKVSYGYDARGQLDRLVLPNTKSVKIGRDEAARINHLDLGGAVLLDLAYDRADRITAIKARGPNAAEIFAETYGFDLAGNVSEIKGAQAQKFDYDKVDRLKKISGPKGGSEFRYDTGGNLWVSGTTRWVLDKIGRPLQQGPTVLTWDAAGNLARSENSRSRTENMFDAAGRLTQRTQDKTSSNFGYLPNGDRLWKEGPKGKIWFAYLNEALAGFKDESGTSWLVVNLPGTDWPLALCGSNGKNYFVIADRLQSTRRLVDESGNVVASIDFGAFGNIEQQNGDAPLSLYAGMVVDERGLFYARQRYYDPSLARFISIDPLPGSPANPASYNAYSYALNNPTRYRDPQGTDATAGWDLTNLSVRELGEWYKAFADEPKMLDPYYNEVRRRLPAFNRSLGLGEGSVPNVAGGAESSASGTSSARQSVTRAIPRAADDAAAVAARRTIAVETAERAARSSTPTLAVETAEQVARRTSPTVAVEVIGSGGSRLLGALGTVLKGLAKAGPFVDAAYVTYRNVEAARMISAVGEEAEARKIAAGMTEALKNKLGEIAADPKKLIPMPMPDGKPFNPNNPAHLEQLLIAMSSNLTNNRKPFEGILATQPDPQQAEELARALAAATEVVRSIWGLAQQAREAMNLAELSENQARQQLQKAVTIAAGRALLESDLSGLPLAAEEVKRLTAAARKEAQKLRAAEAEMQTAIVACENASTRTCAWAQQSATATSEEVNAWRTQANSLIFAASNQLNKVQEKLDSGAVAAEELRRAIAVLEGYEMQLAATRLGETVADAAGLDVQEAMEAAKGAADAGVRSRAFVTRMIAEMRLIPARVRSILAPFSWSPECAVLIAQADGLVNSINEPSPFNFSVLLGPATPIIDAFLANLRRVEAAITSVDISGLSAAGKVAASEAEAAAKSAQALGGNPSRYRALQEASKCVAQLNAKTPAIAANSPTPLPSGSTKPADDEVTVPNLAGIEAREARQALEKLGLTATFLASKEKTSKELEFKVASQDPPANAKEKRGKVVALAIYAKFNEAGEETAQSTSSPTPAGDDLVSVPNVIGLAGKEAKQALEKAGLTATFVGSSEKTSKESEFKVASQEPAASTKAKRGAPVVLAIYGKSNESAEETAAGTVPDVIGLEIRVAQAKIEAAGLKLVGVESGTLKPPTPDKAYRIYAQTPKAGEPTPSNKFVSVKEYGSGKASEPPPAPSVSSGSGGGDFAGQWTGAGGLLFNIQRTANGYAVEMVGGQERVTFPRTRVEGDRLICEAETAMLKGGAKTITVVYRFQLQGDDLFLDAKMSLAGTFQNMGRLKRKR